MKALWVTVLVAVFVWSAINPADYFTWVLEVAPVVIGVAILAATRRFFPFTGLVYSLILLHCVVLLIGGHYTYAQVPLFEQLKPLFGFERNNYDKLGHFMQGFVPALITREVLIRKRVFSKTAWLSFFVVSFCLALSATYELFEWVVALLTGTSAEAFLGTQGYAWDTQTDMAFALLGAILALLCLSRYHDSQMRNRFEPGCRQ